MGNQIIRLGSIVGIYREGTPTEPFLPTKNNLSGAWTTLRSCLFRRLGRLRLTGFSVKNWIRKTGAEVLGAICQKGGRFRADRRICDFFPKKWKYPETRDNLLVFQRQVAGGMTRGGAPPRSAAGVRPARESFLARRIPGKLFKHVKQYL